MVGWTSSWDVNYRRAVVGHVGSEAMTELATPARYDSLAWGINDQGLIVGGYVPNDYGEPRAFTCSADCSDFVDLNTVTSGVAPGEILYVATQINNRGFISAYSETRTYLLKPRK
jgi:probable HAF family extracellular repeat protein